VEVLLERGSLYVESDAVLGNGFWPKVKADVIFDPEEYGWYFEDSIFAPNAEIGPKGVSNR